MNHQYSAQYRPCKFSAMLQMCTALERQLGRYRECGIRSLEGILLLLQLTALLRALILCTDFREDRYCLSSQDAVLMTYPILFLSRSMRTFCTTFGNPRSVERTQAERGSLDRFCLAAFSVPLAIGDCKVGQGSFLHAENKVKERPRRSYSTLLLASAYQRGKCAENQYVYIPAAHAFLPGTLVDLPVEEQQHLRARRVRAPATVRLFNGRGGSATATLCDGGGIAEVIASGSESEGNRRRHLLDVCFCVPRKASRADWLVEKLTELGASTIFCLTAKRSAEALSDAKITRLERLCVAAAKQSLQEVVPAISVLQGGLKELCSLAGRYDTCLVLSPDGRPILRALQSNVSASSQSALIVAGPEGGFSDDEEAELVAAGFVQAGLGPGRLRVETAIMAAASAFAFTVDALSSGSSDFVE